MKLDPKACRNSLHPQNAPANHACCVKAITVEQDPPWGQDKCPREHVIGNTSTVRVIEKC